MAKSIPELVMEILEDERVTDGVVLLNVPGEDRFYTSFSDSGHEAILSSIAAGLVSYCQQNNLDFLTFWDLLRDMYIAKQVDEAIDEAVAIMEGTENGEG